MQIKKEFKIAEKLLQEPGFTWDDSLKSFQAAPEVWDAYISVSKTFIPFSI
jgi:hypothetical protein